MTFDFTDYRGRLLKAKNSLGDVKLTDQEVDNLVRTVDNPELNDLVNRTGNNLLIAMTAYEIAEVFRLIAYNYEHKKPK
jgi:hypothetical protein